MSPLLRGRDLTLTIGPAPRPTSVARRAFLCRASDVRCPAHHHIRQDTFVLDHAGLRCKHRPPRRQDVRGAGEPAGYGPECGALVYVLACASWTPVARRAAAAPGAPADAADGYLVAEVTHAELREMQRRRLDIGGVLAFLGVDLETVGWMPAAAPLHTSLHTSLHAPVPARIPAPPIRRALPAARAVR